MELFDAVWLATPATHRPRARFWGMAQTSTADAPSEDPASKQITGAAFWALMARWGIPDDQALKLIDHAPGASDKRPRFALTSEQAERLDLLREIDRHAADIYDDAGEWLRRPNRSTMFSGKPPVFLMATEGREGIEAVLRYLNKMTFSGSVAAKPRRR